MPPHLASSSRLRRGGTKRIISHRGKSGASDEQLSRFAIAEDLIIVTNNARDFRRLMAGTELHPGLVIVVSNVTSKVQRELFGQVLEWIKQRQLANLINKVVEIDFGGARIYDLPATYFP